MRTLAIDLGDRRTGLAIGDSITGIATPIGQLEIPIERAGGRDLLGALANAIDEHTDARDTLVMGLPINMDGTEGPRAKLVRAYAAKLAARVGRPIGMVDERRTSVAAEERLNQSGLTRKQKKGRRDAIAAAEILRACLDGPGPVDWVGPSESGSGQDGAMDGGG